MIIHGDHEFLDDVLERKEVWLEDLMQGDIVDITRTPVPPLALQKELEKVLKRKTVYL